MKAEELRIKNFVTLSDKQRQDLHDDQINARNEFFMVETIYSDGDIAIATDDEIIDISESLVDPIPLTEEWLLKFGFEHTKTDAPMWINSFCIKIPSLWGNQLIIEAKEEEQGKGIEAYLILTHARALRVEKKYKYVHQLQNLYFALTQTELQLTEK